MKTGLTPTVAADLGKNLKFLRQARGLLLDDVAKGAGISITYLQNIESGVRTNTDEDRFVGVADGLRIDRDVLRDLLLRGRVLSALELRGLDAEKQNFVWRGTEQRINEVGLTLQTDMGKIINQILESNGR